MGYDSTKNPNIDPMAIFDSAINFEHATHVMEIAGRYSSLFDEFMLLISSPTNDFLYIGLIYSLLSISATPFIAVTLCYRSFLQSEIDLASSGQADGGSDSDQSKENKN